jgi:hypothetical protein
MSTPTRNGRRTGRDPRSPFQKPATQFGFDILPVETGVVSDPDKIASWYRENAERGVARSQYNLGICLENGIGCVKDENEAVTWYRKAADQGHARAQCQLGYCLQLGIGCVKDENEAVTWYRKAADQENDLAQNNLGFCLENGIGVTKNISESILWYCRSTLNKNISAKETLTSKLERGFKLEQSKDNTPLNAEEIIEVVEGLSLCDRVSLGKSDIMENLVQLSISEKKITTQEDLSLILDALLAGNSKADLTESRACLAIKHLIDNFHHLIDNLGSPVSTSETAATPSSTEDTTTPRGKTSRYRGGANHQLVSDIRSEEEVTVDLDAAPPKLPHGSVTKPKAKSSSTSTDDERSL